MTNASGGLSLLNPARWSTAVFVALAFATSLPAQNGTVSFTEYSVPAIDSVPVGIVNGPDGAVWFAERSKIGRISSNGTITEYSDAGGGLYITNGPDGALWFTGNGKVKLITTSGAVSQFSMPSTSSDPTGITSGPRRGNMVYREQQQQDRKDDDCRRCHGIRITHFRRRLRESLRDRMVRSGLLRNRYRIGRITTSGAISEFTPTAFSGPSDIVTGPDGALWFTEVNSGKIGRITTAGTITEFPLLTFDSPRSITSGPDGHLWIAQRSWIVKMSTDGVVNEYRVPNMSPSFGGQISDLIALPGVIWFTDSNGRIGRMDMAANGSGATLVQSYRRSDGIVDLTANGGDDRGEHPPLRAHVDNDQTVSVSDNGQFLCRVIRQNQDQNEHQIRIFMLPVLSADRSS
jgi:virginiamycin B lyase